MQPWIEKAGSSSGHNSSLHYDKTLSHINSHHHPLSSQQQQQSSSSRSSINGFRTSSSSSSRDMNTTSYNNNISSSSQQQQKPLFESYNFSPVYTNSNMMSLSDGSDVLNFLNSTSYSDQVHGDDLRPDSMTYISHRHQLDTQHALSEKEKLLNQWTTELMATEDIVEYLRNTTYTEDIYGIPVIGQWIKEAKEQVNNNNNNTGTNNKKAIERLSMIRNHLVEKAMGDFELAAQNAFKMNENDWSSSFLDSSSL